MMISYDLPVCQGNGKDNCTPMWHIVSKVAGIDAFVHNLTYANYLILFETVGYSRNSIVAL